MSVEKGLKGNEWIQSISSKIGGKGGGKAESAQASGNNVDSLSEVLKIAEDFAKLKLSGLSEELVYQADSVSSSLILIIAQYSDISLPLRKGSTTSLNYKGVELSQISSIVFALAPPSLKANNDPFLLASILQWIEFSDTIFKEIYSLLVGKSPRHENKNASLLPYLEYLNRYLSNYTFLVGDRLSIADFYLFCYILPASEIIFKTEKQYDQLIHLKRWFSTIKNQSPVLKALRK